MKNYKELTPSKRLLELTESIENSYNELADKEQAGETLTEYERGQLETVSKLMYLLGY